MKGACVDVRHLTPQLGSVVRGVSLSEPLTEKDAARLRCLLVDRGVLAFPEQHELTRTEQVAFAARFGPIERSPRGEPTDPDIVRIVHGVGAPPTENIWHADMSFRSTPLLGSVLRAIEVPEAGGDTLFADMRAVWRLLPASVREVLWGLRCTHDVAKWVAPTAAVELHENAPPVVHPVVRLHPTTGESVLNVNRGYTTSLVDVDEATSRAMLDYLFEQVTVPEVQCRIKWEPDTVVLWDNRMVQHYATGDYLPATRIMERVTIAGGLVVGPAPGAPVG